MYYLTMVSKTIKIQQNKITKKALRVLLNRFPRGAFLFGGDTFEAESR